MNIDGYKKEILREQYEQYLEKADQARSNDDLNAAAAAYRKAADRLRQLEKEDKDLDYSQQIKKLQTAASLAEDGEDPIADKSPEESQSSYQSYSAHKSDRSNQSNQQDQETKDTDGADYRDQVESFIIETDVTWTDIGGLSSVKTRLKRTITLGAVQDTPPAVTATDRVLLFGPPGTGKTLLASAIAGSLDATFFDVKLGGLLSKYFGESSKQITALFDLAAELSPSVIFLDEIDALTQSRESSSDETSRRVLNTLLSELDGINKNDDEFVLVIGATNKPRDLDNAVRRRFPERILIPLPDVDAASEIVRIHTVDGGVEFSQAKPQSFTPNSDSIAADSAIQAIAETCVKRKYTGSDIGALCRRAIDQMIQRTNPDLAAVADQGLVNAQEYNLDLKPLSPQDVRKAFELTSASLSEEEIQGYHAWDEMYGTGRTQ